MAQTFSIRSEELSRFLGTAFLNADALTIVSPWVSDITVRFPETADQSAREMSLSSVIRSFSVDVTIIVAPDAADHNWRSRSALLPKVEDHVTLRSIENLHAKAIVTDSILYLGSANITYSGFNLNIELCEIRENTHTDTEAFLEKRLGL